MMFMFRWVIVSKPQQQQRNHLLRRCLLSELECSRPMPLGNHGRHKPQAARDVSAMIALPEMSSKIDGGTTITPRKPVSAIVTGSPPTTTLAQTTNTAIAEGWTSPVGGDPTARSLVLHDTRWITPTSDTTYSTNGSAIDSVPVGWLYTQHSRRQRLHLRQHRRNVQQQAPPSTQHVHTQWVWK